MHSRQDRYSVLSGTDTESKGIFNDASKLSVTRTFKVHQRPVVEAMPGCDKMDQCCAAVYENRAGLEQKDPPGSPHKP